jgi:hypothetical protein
MSGPEAPGRMATTAPSSALGRLWRGDVERTQLGDVTLIPGAARLSRASCCCMPPRTHSRPLMLPSLCSEGALFVPDKTYPNMWHIKHPDCSLSDMANLTWARDCGRAHAHDSPPVQRAFHMCLRSRRTRRLGTTIRSATRCIWRASYVCSRACSVSFASASASRSNISRENGH